MDYSTSIHDSDHPAGDSPWGNSPAVSPQPSQTAFGTLGGEQTPASPSAFGSHIAGNGFGSEPDNEGFGSPDHGFGRRPDTASTAAGSETNTQTSDAANRDTSTGEEQHGSPQDSQGPSSLPNNPDRFSGDTARASQEQAQASKPAGPQYKLQAKITGLERAARKDPILRFDVHVSIGEHNVPLVL